MNKPLLRKIQEQILDEPKSFIMHTWARTKDADNPEYMDDDGKWVEFSACGTAACIGGWAGILVDGKYTDMMRSAKILELTEMEAVRLFSAGSWPSELYLKFVHAKTPEERACAGSTRIGHFIRTDGTDEGEIQWTKPEETEAA